MIVISSSGRPVLAPATHFPIEVLSNCLLNNASSESIGAAEMILSRLVHGHTFELDGTED